MCSESQVYHDGEGHEVCHPGRKNGGFPSQTKLFRHFAIQPSFLRSSHTRSSSTFKDMDVKYRILISVGRLSISDISAARVAAFWLLLCHDLQ